MISVIIPTLNEEKTLPLLLKDLSTQTLLPKEIIVVDAYSVDNTKKLLANFPSIIFIQCHPPVARQRTLGGVKASGDILFFLDADVRLKPTFIRDAVNELVKKKLHIACPWYMPYQSTLPITSIYIYFSSLFFLLQKLFPSGAGSAIIVKKKLFEKVKFNISLRYDDIAFIRNAARKGKFGIISQTVYVSDRRFRKYGTLRMLLTYSALSIFFLFNLYHFAHIIPYAFNIYKKEK